MRIQTQSLPWKISCSNSSVQMRSFSEKDFGVKESTSEGLNRDGRIPAAEGNRERKETVGKGWSDNLRFDPNGNKLINVTKIRRLSELIFSLLKVRLPTSFNFFFFFFPFEILINRIFEGEAKTVHILSPYRRPKVPLWWINMRICGSREDLLSHFQVPHGCGEFIDNARYVKKRTLFFQGSFFSLDFNFLFLSLRTLRSPKSSPTSPGGSFGILSVGTRRECVLAASTSPLPG